MYSYLNRLFRPIVLSAHVIRYCLTQMVGRGWLAGVDPWGWGGG
jgi:hypothetical protein